MDLAERFLAPDSCLAGAWKLPAPSCRFGPHEEGGGTFYTRVRPARTWVYNQVNTGLIQPNVPDQPVS